MKDEVRKLILKAEDFYNDAEYLFNGQRFLAVINRCYYAQFTIVHALLLTKNIFSKTHNGTIVKFHEEFIKSNLLPKNLGKILNETFEMRQFTDYDVDAEVHDNEVQQILKNSREFLDVTTKVLHNQISDAAG